MKPLIIRFGILVAVLLVIIAVGTFGFTIVEDLPLLDALYFTVVTVATVGYGDVHPITEVGKILAICLIVTGVGTFSGVVVNIAGLLFERMQYENRRQRTNVLIGLFYSEIGTRLLEKFALCDPDANHIKLHALVTSDWDAQKFVLLKRGIENHRFDLDGNQIDFDGLKSLLGEKSDFIVRLIESPSLLEHESFTELLRATIHLREELSARTYFRDLPQTDVAHLINDAKRVYSLLTKRWVDYMFYLKNTYPYLFSLAIRNNPFDEKRSPIVK